MGDFPPLSVSLSDAARSATTHAGLPNAHHTKYTDAEVAAKIAAGIVLPVKTDTGDPASPAEGQLIVNTFDNKVRVYADGAWHDLATW